MMRGMDAAITDTADPDDFIAIARYDWLVLPS